MSKQFPILDLHCDTASEILDGRSLYDNEGMISIKKMKAGGVACQFFAIFVKLGSYDSLNSAYKQFHTIYDNFIKVTNENKAHIAIAHNAKEISALQKEGKIAAVLTLEEGGIIEGKMERIDEFYKMGLRLITILWNYENCMGFSHSSDPEQMKRGLKPFGIEAIKHMQDLGIIIDVSHLSDGGFWDVVKHSKKPFVASHSNARSVCDHTRNLTDDMLKALAKAGGVTGLNFVPKFMHASEKGSFEQVVNQAKHIQKIAGIDTLALGSDFDGFKGDSELLDCSTLPRLIDAFSKAGYSDDEIEKICWKNAMRVLAGAL